MKTLYYKINTYGCQMNVHESEKIAGMLEARGYHATEDDTLADVIVFNTCAIRDGAETKILGNIGATKKLKKAKPDLIIAVCGCMTQQKSRADEIRAKYPQVSIVLGTHNLADFGKYLDTYISDRHRSTYLEDTERPINEDVPMYRTSGHNAWVNIMYGCNNFCTYCIVPYVRGRERSRNFDDIVHEVETLVADGYPSITLLGQNVNSYGNDLHDARFTFPKLLARLDQIPGDYVLKFMTSHPKDLSSELIDIIASSKHISHTIHLPVQSGNNRILALMNRRYTIEKYKGIVNEIRSKIPDSHLTCDIIVGFPTETEEEFMDTYNLVRDIRYDGVFAFMYSPRRGTPASTMEQVPSEVKHDRINRLLKLSKSIIKENSTNFLDHDYHALCDKIVDDTAIFLLDCGKTVNVKLDGSENIRCGKMYDIHVDSLKNNILWGRKINL